MQRKTATQEQSSRPSIPAKLGFCVTLVFLFIGATIATSSNLTDSEILAYESSDWIKETYPYYLSGYDEDGAPIWVYELGKWDIRKFIDKGEKYLNAMDVACDQMFLRFRESGLNSSAKQFTGILDLDQFSFRQAGHFKNKYSNKTPVQFLLSKFVRFEQIARQGSLKQGWILNANFLWQTIWQLGRPHLGALSNSLEVYGTNKEKWMPELLKELPRDQIAECYGGLPNHKPLLIIG